MLVLGLMSGTSADGIDVALARISGAPPNLNAKLLGQTSFTFPRPLRKEILRVAEQQPIGAGDLSRLNFRLGRIFAEAALAACGRLGVPPQRVSLIGSHGQTIFHHGRHIAPPNKNGGKASPSEPQLASTLQIAEPSEIAERTRAPVVADGQHVEAAHHPLVPVVVQVAVTRLPSAWAHSKKTGSLSSVSACSGVFDRSRRVQVTFESGASNVMSIGYGTVRWKKI